MPRFHGGFSLCVSLCLSLPRPLSLSLSHPPPPSPLFLSLSRSFCLSADLTVSVYLSVFLPLSLPPPLSPVFLNGCLILFQYLCARRGILHRSLQWLCWVRCEFSNCLIYFSRDGGPSLTLSMCITRGEWLSNTSDGGTLYLRTLRNEINQRDGTSPLKMHSRDDTFLFKINKRSEEDLMGSLLFSLPPPPPTSFFLSLLFSFLFNFLGGPYFNTDLDISTSKVWLHFFGFCFLVVGLH